MRSGTIAFVIGTLCLLFFKSIPPWHWLLLIASSLSVTSLLLNHPWRRLLLPLIAFLLGVIWVSYQSQLVLQHMLPKPLETKTVIANGTIVSIPVTQGRAIKFKFKINRLSGYSKASSEQLLAAISWYQHAPQLIVGEQWQLCLRLKRPHGFANPGSFDYEAWTFQQGIGAVGYVHACKLNHRLGRSTWHYAIDHIRQGLYQALNNELSSPFKGLIQALTIGVRNNITPAQWAIFSATGTNHLMAISGLHIGLCAGFIYYLLTLIWRIGKLPLLYPTPKVAALAAIIAALSYSALAGFAIPTRRAVIMICCFMIAKLWQRRVDLWTSFDLALLINLIIDPLAIINTGFWLSFAAVGTLIYCFNNRIRPHGLWWRWGRAQGCVAIGLIPLSLGFFHKISLVSVLANCIAIPWVGMLVVPLSLVACVLQPLNGKLAAIIFKLAAFLLHLVWPWLVWLASLHGALIHFGVAGKIAFISLSVALLVMFAPRGMPGRSLVAGWLLPLFFATNIAPNKGALRLTLLDVGQGLSVVVQTAQHILVYDTGPRFSPSLDTGRAVVVPYLLQRHQNHIDMLVISHPDNDHIGGATSILKLMPVATIFTSVPNRLSHYKASYCRAGLSWRWDQVDFEFIYPPKIIAYEDNNKSCVLRITVAKRHILLPGDIELPAEHYLLHHARQLLPADIIVAPHHGSKTSSSMNFLQAVAPGYVLFAVGYRNRFHFPSPEVIKRYRKVGAISSATDAAGAISFDISSVGDIRGPLKYRKLHPHIWRAK